MSIKVDKGPESARQDSFSDAERRLEFAQYTRPRVYRDLEVPPVLLGGNHQDVANAMGSLTEDAGGEAWECTNPWMMDRLIVPALGHRSGLLGRAERRAESGAVEALILGGKPGEGEQLAGDEKEHVSHGISTNHPV